VPVLTGGFAVSLVFNIYFVQPQLLAIAPSSLGFIYPGNQAVPTAIYKQKKKCHSN
jgi:hypothetical protein